ncbi:MAG: endonuclease/exonuclease/phosphatase family protein [Phycisphaerae bacterium]
MAQKQRITLTGMVCLLSLGNSILVAGVPLTPVLEPQEGRPQVNWQDARAVVGTHAFVYGKIIRVGHSRSVHFLNFAPTRPAEFTAVIFNDSMKHFPESLESMYENRFVEINGMVSTYAGNPQIAVAHPDQIRVLDKLPELSTFKPVKGKTFKGSKVKVASFNIYNHFDAVDDPYYGDETTRVKPRKEMETLAATIRKMDADVLALQEVESRGYLHRLVDVFLADMGYDHVVHFDGNDRRGIDVCLISRLPVGPVTSHRHVSFPGPGESARRLNRDLLQVPIIPETGEPFELWVVHLKSNYDGREYAEPLRFAEAQYVRSQLDSRFKQDPGARIIVAGDFNDLWDSGSVEEIVGQGSTKMECFFEEIPEDDRITYNKGNFRSMIDFLLYSPALAKHHVKGSYKLIDGSVDSIGSDHNPIMTQFKLK